MDKKTKVALDEIIRLVEGLPSGIDYDADANNPSPEDAIAHTGGLVYQVARKALEADDA